ncbi:hypothetical protein L7F22_051948 [Adiantum nelumboides]|nr:hypothetical protein [Adiantum nelumboides]
MDECFAILDAHGKFEVDTATSHDDDILLPMGNTLANTVAIAQAEVAAAEQAKAPPDVQFKRGECPTPQQHEESQSSKQGEALKSSIQAGDEDVREEVGAIIEGKKSKGKEKMLDVEESRLIGKGRGKQLEPKEHKKPPSKKRKTQEDMEDTDLEEDLEKDLEKDLEETLEEIRNTQQVEEGAPQEQEISESHIEPPNSGSTRPLDQEILSAFTPGLNIQPVLSPLVCNTRDIAKKLYDVNNQDRFGDMDPARALHGAQLIWVYFPTGVIISCIRSLVPAWNEMRLDLIEAATTLAKEYFLDNGTFVATLVGEDLSDVVNICGEVKSVFYTLISVESFGDELARSTIMLSLHKFVYFNVKDAKGTYGVWQALGNLYEKKGLQAEEAEFQDSVKAMFLLVTLPNSWNSFYTTINNLALENGLKCADVESSLLMEELNHKNEDDSRSSNAMHVRGRQQSRGNHGSSDRKESKSRERSKSRSGKDVECYHCHKKDHVKKDCYKWKNMQAKKNKVDNGKEKVSDSTNNVKIEELNALTYDSDGDVLYTSSLSTAFLIASSGSYEQDWIVDSSASFYVTPHMEWFSSYEGRHGIVCLGNSYACEIVGAGDIKISLPNGSQFTFTNVRHGPKLTKSLISIGQLDDDG